MSKTLDANRILEEFLQYEPRPFEYPVYPFYNRAKQKWFNPTDNKVVDIKKPWLVNPAANKKEKKKWILKQPAWYANREDILKRIKTLNEYLANPDLKFEEDFVKKAKTELTRMASEERLLKRLEDDYKIIEEATKPKRR